MKHNLFIAIYIIFFFLCPNRATAQTQAEKENTPDSIRISLLTCDSGDIIYTLFGHTAIRYENFTQNIDAVFNYGIFNFNTPNFEFRFALGETDYKLGVVGYEHFANEYSYYGRDVWQQTLNLNQKEKERLVYLLEENYRPENREYRYNFFYDNCATRPRNQIEKAIDGKLQYADNMTENNTGFSFRDLIHQYSQDHLWSRFGIDLCLGSGADKPINRRTMMFIPFYVQKYFSKALIADKEGNTRPLVSSEDKVIITHTADNKDQLGQISPMQTALLLFALVLAATIYGIYYSKTLWEIDLALFFVAGIVGCVLTFMVLFSQHPTVSPNYLLFVFQPLHLFSLPCMLNRVRKRKISRYMMANLAVLTLFIGFWAVIPQRIDLAVLPLALCLLIRSVSNLIIVTREQRGKQSKR